MANKRQKKKNAKRLGTYTGQQYKGGRDKGTKNLQKVEGGYVNANGVFFTIEEKKALETAVNTANRKRARMLKEAAPLPRKLYGVDTGDTVGSLQLMGKESDFILAPKSKSLQQFETKEDYEYYLTSVRKVNKRNYIPMRIELYRRNFCKSLLEVYGREAQDIVDHVNSLSLEDYMKKVESDETLEIKYEPSDVRITGRLNQIRAALEMGLQEEWPDETIDVD